MMRLARHITGMRQKRNAYSLLVGKPEGNRQVGRPRRRWVDNVKTDLGEIELGGGGIEWIGLVQVRDNWGALVNAAINLLVT
jgi:hypothetical protein